jgi:hypothetical protein
MSDNDTNLRPFPAAVSAPGGVSLDVMRATVQELVGRSNALTQITANSLLDPRPINNLAAITESLPVIMRGLAIILDDILAASGQAPEIQFHRAKPPEGSES